MAKPIFDRTIPYMFRGQLWYARKAKGESIMAAVIRAIGRKGLGPVTCWWSESRDGHDVYTAKWFDAQSETFEQCEVIV